MRWSVAVLGALLATSHAAEAAPPVAATPDATALAAQSELAHGEDDLGALLFLAHLRDRAADGKVDRMLQSLAKGDGPLADTARWLARRELPASTWHWPGLARGFAVVGPYQDVGGGLDRVEGPETAHFRFASTDDSWGVYRVVAQTIPRGLVSPRGVPLDRFIAPRRETCSYLVSRVEIPETMRVVVNLASTGAVKMWWDGHVVARDEAVHARAVLDRLAVEVPAAAGPHRLQIKVCSGARDDAGRVRVRFSAPSGEDLTLDTSGALHALDALATPQADVTTEKVHTTPLQRALDAASGASPSPTNVLRAAMVARLAGADDLRAERAPGWLDRVVASRPTPTVRALAGDIAPSEANRSGWLQQVVREAPESAAGAFAQRRLIEHRLDGGAVDLARQTSRQPPFSEATDADAVRIRARIDARLGGDGLTTAARQRLEKLMKEPGSPLAVWRLWGDLAVAPRSKRHAARYLARRYLEGHDVAYVVAHASDGSEVMAELARRWGPRRPDAEEVLALAGLLLQRGETSTSGALFALVAQQSPNLVAAHRGLARAARLEGHDARAETASERVLELDPTDTRTQAELDFRRGNDDGAKLGEDAAYVVPAETFLDRAVERDRATASPGVSERELHWRRVVRLHDDRRVSQLMHYAREIVVPPRMGDQRYESVPKGARTELLIARVHRSDGAVVAPEERDDRGLVVKWPRLERGDVVEVAVRTWTRGPVGRRGDPPFHFTDYVGSVASRPSLHNEVVIDTPTSAPMSFDVIGGRPDERREEKKGDRTVTWMVWNQPPMVADEPFAPPLTETIPTVVGSIYPDWASFLTWYRGAVEGFTEPDEQIKRLAQELTTGKRSREEKVEALFNFVADDIRYVNYRSGEWWLPNRPQQLLSRRQGDCDDKAMLLISLLRAVGIEAREVLIQTRQTRRRRIMKSSRVAVPVFDHGIIYLPNESGEGGRFLDATSPQSRMGVLPAMDSGAMALVVEATPKIVETPVAAADDHGETVTWTIKLERDGSGTIQAKETHVGDAAFRLRTHLRQPDTRAAWVEQNLLLGRVSSVTLAPEVTFETVAAGATVGYQATSRTLARREGDDLVLTLAPSTPITTLLAPLAKRSLPVELPPGIAPRHRRLHVEVLAPQGMRFAPAPPDVTVDAGDYGATTVTLKVAKNGRRATIDRAIALKRARIPLADYAAWRRYLQRTDAALRRSLRLTADE